MSFADKLREEARLIILRAIDEQPDGRLNSSLLRDELDERWGINKGREWVHDELRWLADMGAVRTIIVGSVVIASITQKGRDHVERRAIITGVKRPSPPEG